MQKKTLITLLLMLISLVPIIVACSGGGQAQKSKPEPTTIPEPVTTPEPVTFTIGMEEYSYKPDIIQVKVGQEVTLKLVNNGVLPHELMIGRDVAKKDGRPNGYTVDLFESTNVEPMIMAGAGTMDMGDEMDGDNEHKATEAMGDDHMGTMVTVENSGDEASITFVITEDMVGEWEMGCFQLDGVHYDSGMKGTFIVAQ